MENATHTGTQIDDSGKGHFTVYADFNCPFCYALNERLHVMNLEDRVDFRAIQHAPSVTSSQAGFEVLSGLTREVADVRRRTPSTHINVPMFRPNTAAAAALVAAVEKNEPAKVSSLRQKIYRALWMYGQDISDPDLLAELLQELDIESPNIDRELQNELAEWQAQWDSNQEFDRNIPILISDLGEKVIGFPLEPELNAFLNFGSLVADIGAYGASAREPLQRILVLDTDVDSVRMVIEQMREVQVEIAEDFSKLVASALLQGIPDLVLVDPTLIGDVEGTDWWRDINDTELETAVPVIFVSDDNTIQAEVTAFEAGAADFISKPFHPKVLQARLGMHLRARRSQQELNKIARIDSLTSICNRREFDYRLMSEWGRGARSNISLALLMIDVDKFKEYNDHLGHLRGDDCLVAVAQILSGCMQRSGDLIARYGGEEFVMLLPDVDLEGAIKVAEDCRSAIENSRIPHVTSNISPYVTISIGVAAIEPYYDKSSTLLIEQADISLYQAKQNGRNRVCTFTYENLG